MSSTVFILVGTTHAGNLGAAARAIRTMGFDTLRLVDTVSPRKEEALARASGAQPVLESAARFETLSEAIADCQAVFGTSARQRHLSVPLLSCREACDMAASSVAGEAATAERVAFVFGRERSGLTNEELDLCTRHLHIPTDPDFSSLNLGSAVQVVAYEAAAALALRGAGTASPVTSTQHEDRPVSSEAMEHLHAHLERVMINTGFLDPARPRHLMRRLKRYFERNRPTENEMAILRGILSATENPRPPDAAVRVPAPGKD
jgi:TrmH family RNA methyltransferase